MDDARARTFVEGWLSAWNEHDLEGVLALFAQDVRLTSPVAARMRDGSDGVLLNEVLTFRGSLVVAGVGTYRDERTARSSPC